MAHRPDDENGWRDILSDLIRAVEAEAEAAHRVKDPSEKVLTSIRGRLICYSAAPSAYSELPVKVFTKPIDMVDVGEVKSKGLKIFHGRDALLLRGEGEAVGDAITSLLSECLQRRLKTVFVSAEEEAVMEVRERLAGRSEYEGRGLWLLRLLVGEVKEVEDLLRSWNEVEVAIARVGRMQDWLESLWMERKTKLRCCKEPRVEDVIEFEEVNQRLKEVQGAIWKLDISPSEMDKLYRIFGYRRFFASNPPTKEGFQEAMKALMQHARALRLLLDAMKGGVDGLLYRLKKSVEERYRLLQPILKIGTLGRKLGRGGAVRLAEVSEWILEISKREMWVGRRDRWKPRLTVVHGADLISLPTLWILLSATKKCLLVGGHGHPKTLLEREHPYHYIMAMNIFEWQERLKTLKNQ